MPASNVGGFMNRAYVIAVAAVVALSAASARAQSATGNAGATINMTADDAVRRALENNLDIQVQRLEPQLADLQVAATWTAYKPTVTSSLFTQGATNLPTSQLQSLGGSQISNDTLQWNGGFSQNMFRGGGNLAVSFTNSRLNTSDAAATRNPAFQSNVQAQYTQPLLRNFKTDQTRTTLLVNQIQEQISDLNLRSTLVLTEASVRNAYWDLVFAIENIEASRRTLDIAQQLLKNNQARVEIGTFAPIDLVQGQTEVANAQQALVAAEGTRRTNELALKRLLLSGPADPLWTTTIVPTDRPAPSTDPVNVDAALANALKNRIDLMVAQRTLQQNDVSIKSYHNQTLPDLSLIGAYSLQGRGGPEFVREGFGGDIIQTIPGGYWDALSNIGSFTAPTWSLRLNLSVPIGHNAADVAYTRARVQKQQTEVQLRQAQLVVITEVTNAAITVQNTLESMQASRTTRELSEKRLDAATSKLDVGTATSFEVVQAQRDLADARTTELRNILNYRKALVDFERTQVAGTSRTITPIR
jgi:outer membrane protein